ncbi:MAG TPA: hypothetical protein VMT82_08680 [candidate division Zixibacteria bacterium]|nr:hypothetical protein [candidate division Zixibacteria bacterium]
MSRVFSFLALLLAVGVGLYFYSADIRSLSHGSGGSTPKAAADLTGVRADLLQFQRAEQQHLASEGRYFSLQEMRAANDTGLPQDSRAGYRYSVDVNGNSFEARAEYEGTPPPGMPKFMRVSSEGVITQE